MSNFIKMADKYPKAYLYRQIVQAKCYIDKYYGESINLNMIAGAAFFSKYHFIRLFKKAYGRTPHQYLINVRVEKAMYLLKSDHTISEVCDLVGFESRSSFTGLFKKVTGLTPSSYQMNQHRIKAEKVAKPLKFIPHCFAEENGWNKIRNFQEETPPTG